MENNYNIIRIQKYLSGQLSPEEMHALERDAIDDPLLDDAIEGYRMQQDINHGRLSLLQQRLAKRIEDQREERNRFFFTSQRLGIAATAAVLFVLVVLLFWIRSNITSAPVTGSEEEVVQVEMTEGRNWPTKLSVVPVAVEGADGNSAARPAIGWEDFDTYFQSEFNWSLLFSATEIGDHYQISFEIGELAKPTNLMIEVIGKEDQPVNERLKTEIVRILDAGPLWRGTGGAFDLEFHP